MSQDEPPNEPDPNKFTVQTTGFDEAERALALLQGKDPGKVRLQRILRQQEQFEADLAARRLAQRKAEIDEEKRKRNKAIAIKAAIGVSIASVVGVAVWLAWAYFQRHQVATGAFEKNAAPWLSQGFALSGTKFGDLPSTSVQVADGCALALGVDASGAPLALKINLGGAVSDATGTALFCSCDPMSLSVSAANSSRDSTVGILRISGEKSGGPLVSSAAWPTANVSIPTPNDCLLRLLDSHASKRVAPKIIPEIKAPEAVQKGLERAGMKQVIATREAVAVVPRDNDTCYVAIAGSKGEGLSLRVGDNKFAIAEQRGRPLAWCDSAAGPRALLRADLGDGGLVVFAGNSSRIGGALGARALTHRATGVDPALWTNPAELVRDAIDALRASGIAESTIKSLDVVGSKPAANERVVSLSLADEASFAFDPGASAKVRCSPQLELGARQTVCLHAEPEAWNHVSVRGSIGATSAPLPIWMSALANVSDPAALEAMVSLLAVARSLLPERYEPVLTEGVHETLGVFEVIGRANEDAIAAYVLSPKAPFITPLIDPKKPPSTLTEPVIFTLKPGASVRLVPGAALSGPPADRRVVVFRRSTK